MKCMGLLFIVCAFSLAGGCGSSHKADNSAAQNAPPPVSNTMFAPYMRELNKAKNVQKTVNAQKQAMDKQIQVQTGSPPTPAPSSQTP